MSTRSTAVIIGGGIIGASIAWALTKRGIDCTVLDKGAFCAEASTASAGMLCPQAEMLDNVQHLQVFAKSQAMHRPWTEELEQQSQIPVQYIQEGMYRVVFTEAEERTARAALAHAPATVEWLSAAEVLGDEPDISHDIRGAISFPLDGQLHPVYLAKSFKAALIRVGCKLVEWTPVLGLLVDGGRVYGARTAAGEFHADYTVIASGAWSSQFLAPLDFSLPIFPVKGQMLAVRHPGLSLRHTVQGPGGMIIPRSDGTFTIGVTHEETGYDKRATVEGLVQSYQSVSRFIPKVSEATFAKTWAGLRPGTPDGLPFIGPIAGIEGLLVAAGHYTVGILLAPITGEVIAQMITQEPLCVDVDAFRPDRFHDATAYH